MIYVSSSCVKNRFIKDSVLELVDAGFYNIELSGGTEYYENILDDLLEIKSNHDVNFLCHNYFPPPKNHFVLNLASLDDQIYNQSIEHLLNSINTSKKLGAKIFAFHAGFFIDIKVSEIGKNLSLDRINDKEAATNRFIDAVKILEQESGEVKLYIENNVLSLENYETYSSKNIFMLTSKEDYSNLKKEMDFNLLLDVAHLKVSANSLHNNYFDELAFLLNETDYIHVSDNDGRKDSNRCIWDKQILSLIKDNRYDTLTMETYETIDQIKKNHTYIRHELNER